MAERFLTFRVGGELYALPANQVAEVIRLPAVARVPQAPKGLLGLANLRGSVLPVASVRGLMGAEESAEATTRAIVLDGAAPVALAVDVVEALVAVEPEQIETRQAELATRPGERLKGAFAADGKTAIAKILDIEGLIGAAFVQEARARPRRALAGAAVPERETDGEAGGDDRQMLVSFDVAGQEYALALDAVQEIVDTPEALAALPASEALVLGVTPFRNTLLPLLSLRGLLGFTDPDRTHRSREDRRHQGRRRPGRPAGRPHAQHLSGRCRPDREDPAGAVGPRRRRSQDLGDLSRRERTTAGVGSGAGATVPGGRHAAAEGERRLDRRGRQGVAKRRHAQDQRLAGRQRRQRFRPIDDLLNGIEGESVFLAGYVEAHQHLPVVAASVSVSLFPAPRRRPARVAAAPAPPV